ncbi:TetR/AcrR family transcriptional regulator [Sphingomonas crocodyli]|uniref:TetR/AcrR family transcriptional regulator n=1 Tax=Sphingomonas crocodyli TaxID=1979270 RepID=A0A437M6J9_9SPHN|nr:TetR/AcrR family transcriptional regulator [Sphingomonas crocodyli]RVT93185.1 TetR/AcrR family transcriptional regulator [Sphingomonas crocodyli]
MSEAAVGRRESAKEGRRQALVEATRASLTSGEFSMRRVAELAQVSEVTPYNLFGSKAGLLAALYERMIRESETRLPAAGQADPLARVFAAIDGFRDNLARHPAFYRAFFAARLESRGGRSYATTSDAGVDYWHRLIGAAIDVGQIRPGRSADVLVRHFIHLLSGAVQEWIDSTVDPDEWRALVAHGFALVALPLASIEGATILRREMADAARGLRPMGERR